MEVNLKWLNETFGKENVVSCVLHMDERTPHLHTTIVPIVNTERQRREREGEKKYNTKSGPRLSADDVLKRAKLREYQNTYAAAMSEFGLKRGIVGSTARHVATSTHYKQQIQQLEENIAKLTGGGGENQGGQEYITRHIRQRRPCQGKERSGIKRRRTGKTPS